MTKEMEMCTYQEGAHVKDQEHGGGTAQKDVETIKKMMDQHWMAQHGRLLQVRPKAEAKIDYKQNCFCSTVGWFICQLPRL